MTAIGKMKNAPGKTAATYLLRAAILVGGYLLLDLLGFREYTSILSGTLPAPGSSFLAAKCGAAVYLSFYLFAYLLAPIYLLGGAWLLVFRSMVSDCNFATFDSF